MYLGIKKKSKADQTKKPLCELIKRSQNGGKNEKSIQLLVSSSFVFHSTKSLCLVSICFCEIFHCICGVASKIEKKNCVFMKENCTQQSAWNENLNRVSCSHELMLSTNSLALVHRKKN